MTFDEWVQICKEENWHPVLTAVRQSPGGRKEPPVIVGIDPAWLERPSGADGYGGEDGVKLFRMRLRRTLELERVGYGVA